MYTENALGKTQNPFVLRTWHSIHIVVSDVKLFDSKLGLGLGSYEGIPNAYIKYYELYLNMNSNNIYLIILKYKIQPHSISIYVLYSCIL